MEELSYDELRRIQARERLSNLARIPENFYELTSKLIDGYKTKREGDIESIREYGNVLKIIEYIKTRRKEKIIKFAINGSMGAELPENMLQNEVDLYYKLITTLQSWSSELEEITKGINEGAEDEKNKENKQESEQNKEQEQTDWTGNEEKQAKELKQPKGVKDTNIKDIKKESDKNKDQDVTKGIAGEISKKIDILKSGIEEKLSLKRPEEYEMSAEHEKPVGLITTEKTERVYIMDAVEEFVGLDGKNYGPFKINEIVELPKAEVEMLIKMDIAKSMIKKSIKGNKEIVGNEEMASV